MYSSPSSRRPSASPVVCRSEQRVRRATSWTGLDVSMPTEESAAPNHEPWVILWARLVARGWRQETKVRGNGRKDQYYFPPHHRQGFPRKLDSRIKVRRFVQDAAALAQVDKYAAEVRKVRALLQQAQARARRSRAIQQRQTVNQLHTVNRLLLENEALRRRLRAATHMPRSGPGSRGQPIRAFPVASGTVVDASSAAPVMQPAVSGASELVPGNDWASQEQAAQFVEESRAQQ